MRHSYDFSNYTSSAISLICKVKMCYFLQRIGSTSNISLSTVSAVEFFETNMMMNQKVSKLPYLYCPQLL